MKNLLRVVLAVCIVAVSLVLSAQVESVCREATIPTTKIYFVNGVWNTKREAGISMELIKLEYKREFENQHPGQVFEFRVAYNYHTGKARDIIEVIGQKMNELNDPEVNQLTADQYLYLYLTARSFDSVTPPAARVISTTIEEYIGKCRRNHTTVSEGSSRGNEGVVNCS